MTLWNYLVLFMLGCFVFELSSRVITQFEANDDHGSPVYMALVSVAASGAALSVHCLLAIHIRLENRLRKTHGYKIKRSHVDLSLFRECKKVMVFIYRKFRQFVKP